MRIINVKLETESRAIPKLRSRYLSECFVLDLRAFVDQAQNTLWKVSTFQCRTKTECGNNIHALMRFQSCNCTTPLQWWPSGLERWSGDRVVLGSNPAAATSLRNFGNSVYPALPVYFGGDCSNFDCIIAMKAYIEYWSFIALQCCFILSRVLLECSIC